MSPRLARSLKQIRHISKRRIYPRGRPQQRHLLTLRVENLGLRCARTISALRATYASIVRERDRVLSPPYPPVAVRTIVILFTVFQAVTRRGTAFPIRRGDCGPPGRNAPT